LYADKTSNDIQRETILIKQIVDLMEERSITLFPPAGSGIPGKLFKRLIN